MVMGEQGIAALAHATEPGVPPIHNHSARCYGFCPEEQTVLQLEAAGMRVRALPWRLRLMRILHSATPDESVESRQKRLEFLRPIDGCQNGFRFGKGFSVAKAAADRQQAHAQPEFSAYAVDGSRYSMIGNRRVQRKIEVAPAGYVGTPYNSLR